jgi:hypothetical protein
MYNDHLDHTDLYRLADDGCPHCVSDTSTHDVSELLIALGKEDPATR